MTETPKLLGLEIVNISRLDTSGDAEFELYEKGEPSGLSEAIGLAVGAASMTWPVVGGVFRDAKAKRIMDALEMYVRDWLDTQNDEIREELRVEKQVSAAIDSEWAPLAPVPPQLVTTIRAFISEYHRAKAKHGEMTMDGTMSGNPIADDALRFAALVEEVGEVAHELTYDQQDGVEWSDGSVEGRTEGGQLGRLMKELVQVMNVAGTWHSYLVPGPTIPAPEQAAEPTPEVPVGTLTTGRLGRVREAYGDGSTVRVPKGACAVMVPKDRLREVLELLDPLA